MPPVAAVARRRFRARGRDGALLIGRARINRADIMKSQDKASDFQLYLRLLTYVKPYHRVFAIAVAAMVVLALVNPALAALFKRITEGVFLAADADLMAQVVIPTLAVFFIAAGAAYIARYALAWVAEKFVMDLRMEMFARLLQLSCASLDRHASSNLISKFTYDVTQLKEAGTRTATTLIRDTLSIVGLVAWMIYVNWLMALLALLAGPCVLFILLAIRRRLRKVSQALQDSMAGLHHVLGEVTAGHRMIKIFAGREQERERFRQRAAANRRYNMKFIAAAAATLPTLNIVTAIVLAAIFYVAAGHAVAGRISVAEFNSFFAALLMLLNPMRRLARVNEDLQKGLAASESVFAFIDQEVEPDSGAVDIGRLKGAIEVRGLTFGYDDESGPVLRDVSLDIAPGQSVAIVGPSGSGKTSLINLMPRFYDAFAGAIRLDGHDIRALSLSRLRENIALVSQDVVLLDDTVRNNIAFGGNRGASLEQVMEAARQADALGFIEALENGFDTPVGAAGSRLSGGQRQRLALARALLKNAPILILDEATSALDGESERNIQQALAAAQRDKTCIIIAHRLSTVERADHVFVLEAGRLVESGSPAALLAQGGAYARLQDREQMAEKLNPDGDG